MSKVELRLNGLIDAFKNKMDEISKLKEFEKALFKNKLKN